jgi:porin
MPVVILPTVKNPWLVSGCLALVLGLPHAGHAQGFDIWDGTGLWLASSGMTGEWDGVRPALDDRGVHLFADFTAEVWGNTTGGMKTGAVYTGLLAFGLELDLETFAGWSGASVSTTWSWSTGKDASAELVGNYLTISNIAAFPTLRMSELWFQQTLWDERVSLRIGQLTADSEFVISDYAALFVNGTFGWPAFMYLNLLAGGPGYPLGTLGARLSVSPKDWLTLQSAIFQGNVYDEDVNRDGFRWRLDGENGFLFLNEAQVRWNHADNETGLPGQGKLGFWAQSGELADVLATATQSGNFGFYGILDQMIFREAGGVTGEPESKSLKSLQPSTPDGTSDQGLGWFGRLGFQPYDRNFLSFYFDTGVSYTGFVPGRDVDVVGLAFAYAPVGSVAGAQLLAAGTTGISAEMALELTYQANLTPWLSVQPDIQVILNPGGSSELSTAVVTGLRVGITF